jgi:hypothetical protein
MLEEADDILQVKVLSGQCLERFEKLDPHWNLYMVGNAIGWGPEAR